LTQLTPTQLDSKNLMNEIFEKDYYVLDLLRVLNAREMNQEIPIEEYDDEVLIEMWNDFWFSLPDSPVIRTGPFFALCDICERIFDNPE
jgi:hypothetical protein